MSAVSHTRLSWSQREGETYSYHCVSVLLQLFGGHFFVMLLEQVIEECLRDKSGSHDQTDKQTFICFIVFYGQQSKEIQLQNNNKNHICINVICLESLRSCSRTDESEQKMLAEGDCGSLVPTFWMLHLEQEIVVWLCECMCILLSTSPWAPELICSRCNPCHISSISTVDRKGYIHQCLHAALES